MSAPSVTTRSGQRASVEVDPRVHLSDRIQPAADSDHGRFAVRQLGAIGFGGGGSSSLPGHAHDAHRIHHAPRRCENGSRSRRSVLMATPSTLSLAPEVTEFDGFINYGSPIQTAATDALGNPTIDRPHGKQDQSADLLRSQSADRGHGLGWSNRRHGRSHPRGRAGCPGQGADAGRHPARRPAFPVQGPRPLQAQPDGVCHGQADRSVRPADPQQPTATPTIPPPPTTITEGVSAVPGAPGLCLLIK